MCWWCCTLTKFTYCSEEFDIKRHLFEMEFKVAEVPATIEIPWGQWQEDVYQDFEGGSKWTPR